MREDYIFPVDPHYLHFRYKGGHAPKMPPPPPPTPTPVQLDEQVKQKERDRRRQMVMSTGRQGTILTEQNVLGGNATILGRSTG